MKLKKVLTLRTVVATSAGLTLASSSFVAAVQVAGFLAGDAAWIAILIGGVLCLAAGSCFSELNDVLPSAAGIRLYFGKAFGEKTALTVSLLYMLVIMGVVGAESYILAQILSYALPSVAPVFWVVVMLVAVTLMNIRGIRIAGNFQDIITYGLMVSLVIVSFIGLSRAGFHLTAPLATGGVVSLLNAVAVGVFLFVGFEWVAPLAEEVTNTKLVSKGMFIALGLLSVIYSIMTVAMTATVPRPELTSSPIPHIIFAKSILGDAGVFWMLIISLAASITSFNAGMISVSRLLYATAREHALPKVFSKISMRYFTPWVAILTVFVFGLTFSFIILFSGKYLIAVNIAAASECIVYAMAGTSVLVLRKKLNDKKRTFKMPWGPVIPVLTTIVFAVLAVGIFVTDPLIVLWLAIGFAAVWIYVDRLVPVFKEKYRVSRNTRRRPEKDATEAGN